MVEQIEELGAESKHLTFPDFEAFGEREIDVRLSRADDAVAWRVSISGGAIRAIRHDWRGGVSSRVDPIRELSSEAA